MLKRFTTKELIFITLMGALLFVVNLFVGGEIVVATGLPPFLGIITGVASLTITTFVALLLRRFGCLSLLILIYSILALPTNLAGGPPGFFLKVPLMVLATLVLEMVLSLTQYRTAGFIVGLPLFAFVNTGLFLMAFRLLGMPEFSALLSVVEFTIIGGVILGYIGMWFGFMLFKKLKDKHFLKQFRS